MYVIHLFRMTLFMLLAGYFGRLVLQRRGPGRYLRDRVLRILLPFIVFWPISVLSLDLAVVNAQVHRIGLVAPPTPEGPAFLMINPGQLWFLLVLMQCVVIMLVVRGLAVLVLGQDRCADLAARCGTASAPAGVVIAALPYAIGLRRRPCSAASSRPACCCVLSLITYLGAFAVGWWLHARSDALTRIARWWPVYLAGAVILTVVGLGQSDPGSTTPLPVAAGVMAVAGWCWVYGLLGVCTRHLTGERPSVRYLADASYWMYLIHLPLLVGFEILLVALDWPILIKLGLTWVVVERCW